MRWDGGTQAGTAQVLERWSPSRPTLGNTGGIPGHDQVPQQHLLQKSFFPVISHSAPLQKLSVGYSSSPEGYVKCSLVLLARQTRVDRETTRMRKIFYWKSPIRLQYLMAHGHMKYQFISLIKSYTCAYNTYCYTFSYLCKIFHEVHSKQLILLKNIHFESIIGFESWAQVLGFKSEFLRHLSLLFFLMTVDLS